MSDEEQLYCDECREPVESALDLWEGLCEDCRVVDDEDIPQP